MPIIHQKTFAELCEKLPKSSLSLEMLSDINHLVNKNACGNCINFCKISKRSGRCNFHTIWIFDKKLNQYVIKKMTVYKHNYCDNWKQKINIKQDGNK